MGSMTRHNDRDMWDAVVVGGGAAGLSAALMLGRARRRTLVIDEGRPRNRFAHEMHGVLGHDGVAPADFLERGRREVRAYGVEVREGARVSRLEAGDRELRVEFEGGRSVTTRALVLATGITDELPAIPGLAEGWGSTVLHCPYCHGWEVRGERLGVLTTSPAGLHQAELVRQWSDDVTVFADGLGSALDDDARARLAARGVRLVGDRVVEVRARPDGALEARLQGDRTPVVLDAIFTAGAPRPHDALVRDWGLARTETALGSFLAVDQSGRTSHERVWAAGNVVSPFATVPVSMAAGSMAGAGVNAFLVGEDARRAVGDGV